MKEKEREQKKIISLSAIAYLVGFLLPGLDRRFDWSEIPTAIVLAADVLVMTSYIFVVYVFKHNRYASRVIEVQKNQTVISTGPYSIVRHPMYSGMFIMFFSTPIALGSYWAVIPFALMPLTFFFRILNEEKVLSEQLPGYKEYCEKVRYRLIPYVW
jgi:protein-S-isoprenylcysteine O-methyltransferase Ste14